MLHLLHLSGAAVAFAGKRLTVCAVIASHAAVVPQPLALLHLHALYVTADTELSVCLSTQKIIHTFFFISNMLCTLTTFYLFSVCHCNCSD